MCLNPYASNVFAKYKVHLIRLSQPLVRLNLDFPLGWRFIREVWWGVFVNKQINVLIAALRLGTKHLFDFYIWLTVKWCTLISSVSFNNVISIREGYCSFLFLYLEYFVPLEALFLLSCWKVCPHTHTHTQCVTFNLVDPCVSMLNHCFLFLCFFISLQEIDASMVWISGVEIDVVLK